MEPEDEGNMSSSSSGLFSRQRAVRRPPCSRALRTSGPSANKTLRVWDCSVLPPAAMSSFRGLGQLRGCARPARSEIGRSPGQSSVAASRIVAAWQSNLRSKRPPSPPRPRRRRAPAPRRPVPRTTAGNLKMSASTAGPPAALCSNTWAPARAACRHPTTHHSVSARRAQ